MLKPLENAANWWERIIVPIGWHLGGLKETYLGDHRLPNFGCRCLNGNSNIGTSNADIDMFKNWPLAAELRLQMFEYQCLNIQTLAFKRWQPIFERVLPTNRYYYTLLKLVTTQPDESS